MDTTQRSAFKIIRTSPGFVQMFTGQGISAFGDWMATVAFMVLTAAVSGGNGIAIGGVLVLRLTPGLIAGPLAARIANRFDYRRTMMAMDGIRAVMIGLVPLVYSLWWIYLWAFLIEVCSLIFIPARDSSIPELVDDERALPLANSLILASSFGTIPLGAGAFALVSALASGIDLGFIHPATHPAVFWLDTLTYLGSLFFISRIGTLKDVHPGGDSETGSEDESAAVAFREAFQIPFVRTIILPVVTITLGLGALFSLGITLLENVMHASDTEFGLLIAVFGVGAGAGVAILQIRGDSRSLKDFRIAVTAVGASIFLTVLTPFLWLALVGAVFFGAAASYAMAGGMSMLQERVDDDHRLLAFTAFHVTIRGGLGLGAIVAGAIGQVGGTLTLPGIGDLRPSQWVLALSGLVVVGSATLITEKRAQD